MERMDWTDETLCKHYGILLGLEEGWGISEVNLDLAGQSLTLRVEWKKDGAICPTCGEPTIRYDLAPERRWRHLDAMGFTTTILCRVPRAKCPIHGVVTMSVPWAGKHSRFTLAFEALALKVLKMSNSIEAACNLLKLSWDSAQEIINRGVERGVERRSIEEVKRVGVDEKSFLRGQSYASILYDLEAGTPRVLEVSMGRDTEAAEIIFEILPESVREKVEAVCMDMSGIYRPVAESYCPKAAIVYDRFHVSKYLNESVDAVRRSEHARLLKEGEESLLTGMRQMFLFNKENVPEEKKDEFEIVCKSDLKASKAWALKESFRTFWQCRDPQQARILFKKWYRRARRSKLGPVIKVAEMLKGHLDGLVNYTLFPVTNGVAEGFNSKIQSLRASARGFRSFLNYRARILFHCGKLDMAPLIH